MDIVSISNRILRSKGNLIRINFAVDGTELRAFVPDDEVFGAVKDVLLNREYEYLSDFELVNFEDKIVVDAGAHVGLFSLVASTFAKKVISIEPHPVNFNLLKINKILNNAENIMPIDRALWFEKKTLNLHEGAHTGSSSIIQHGSYAKCYNVCTVTLKEIIDNFGEIELLKMDVEGSEFEIFKHLNGDFLRDIKCIVAEIHRKAGNAGQIIDFLSSQDFRVDFFYPPLLKNTVKYQIEVKNLLRLKMWRKLVYSLSSLVRMKDRSLMILFAKRE